MIVRRPDNPQENDSCTGVRIDGGAAGLHAIIELYDCPHDLLDDEAHVRETICQAAEVAGANLLNLSSHGFSPHGVTALALLAESHISIHTWPELGYAAADIFTCGRQDLVTAATEFMVKKLGAGRHTATSLARGEKINPE